MLERPFSMDAAGGVLTVTGAVDEFSIVQLRNTITEHVTHGDLVIDLSDVDVLPSVGVGVLARAMEQARRAGRRIDLVAAPETIAQRVLHVCGLPYRHSVAEALDPPDADESEPVRPA